MEANGEASAATRVPFLHAREVRGKTHGYGAREGRKSQGFDMLNLPMLYGIYVCNSQPVGRACLGLGRPYSSLPPRI